MLSAVTVSLVPEVRGGPFVFWDDLAKSARDAKRLGFDALEVFPRSAAEIPTTELRRVLAAEGLKLAALGTGAGWVVHKLRLTDPDADVRRRAVEFIAGIARVAGEFGAAVIIGSMQGRIEPGVPREQGLEWLCEGVAEIARAAESGGGVVLLEPLNRYETNVLTSVAESAALVRKMAVGNVKLLCDLFHMNIEEADLAASLTAAAETVGHIHFADSNRRAIGYGHLDVPPVIAALRGIGYSGYLSAEVFPLPDELAAAETTIASFRKYAR
jgi:sugar phosphate isomerase/epimerase